MTNDSHYTVGAWSKFPRLLARALPGTPDPQPNFNTRSTLGGTQSTIRSPARRTWWAQRCFPHGVAALNHLYMRGFGGCTSRQERACLSALLYIIEGIKTILV